MQTLGNLHKVVQIFALPPEKLLGESNNQENNFKLVYIDHLCTLSVARVGSPVPLVNYIQMRTYLVARGGGGGERKTQHFQKAKLALLIFYAKKSHLLPNYTHTLHVLGNVTLLGTESYFPAVIMGCQKAYPQNTEFSIRMSIMPAVPCVASANTRAKLQVQCRITE
uniref:Uncharacterized protein n=1 Tax=Sphaerodactylus townsendi TaxID=933632 RepID=A0ACB8ECU7_9SAUR